MPKVHQLVSTRLSVATIAICGVLVFNWYWCTYSRPNNLSRESFEFVMGVKQKYPTEVLKEALLQMHEKFTACGLSYAITHGTLLGVLRDGQPLYGDNDVDIVMIQEPGAREALLECLQQPKEASLCNMAENPSLCKEQHKYTQYTPHLEIVQNQAVLVDIYWVTLKNGRVCYCWDELCAVPAELILPFKPINEDESRFFKLNKVYVPQAPEKFLAMRYGKNWRHPLASGIGSSHWINDGVHGNGNFVDYLLQPFYGDAVYDCCGVHNEHPTVYYYCGGCLIVIIGGLVYKINVFQ